jgi:aspartate/methionine/tyrosine aminotransferase
VIGSRAKTAFLSRHGHAKRLRMTATIEPFHAISIGMLAYELAAQGRSVIHMEYGQPSTGAPARAIAVAHEVLDGDPMGYWESAELRARIARMYAEEHGVAVAVERIVLTCGASPALVLALSALFAPGARVATARPGYVAYRNVLKALHMTPVEIDCGEAQRFQLTADALAAIEPAPEGVILASPANPTGTVIAPDELARIAAVCRARGIRIVSDEIYQGISYVGPVRTTLAAAPDALVVNSFSKYFSMAGWRLGWLVVPPALIGPVRARQGNLFLTPPSLAQHAGLAAFDCRDELEGHIATYARNRDLMLAGVARLGLSHIAPPDGAFYVYADVGHLTEDSLAFCRRMLEDTGVATAPGIDFDPVHGHRFMRFSFAVSTVQVEEALARLEPWFAAQPRLVEPA